MNRIKLIGLLIVMSVACNTYAQPIRKTYFGIGLFTSANSSLITFAYIYTTNGKVTGAEVIRRDRFVYTALGHWPHPANLDRENLFEKFGVDSVFLLKSESNKILGYYAPVFEQLWKIKFYEHPFEFDTPGWSQGQYKPSLYQKEFLKKEYGIDNILSEYIYGDSLFKLLRDVQNPLWIEQYRFVTKDTTKAP